jgi:hypothetical protein
MKKEMLQGKEFIATLSTEELTWVAEQLAFNLAEERIHDLVINKGKMVSEADREALRQVVKETFLKKGNKHLLKVLKDEFKDVEIKMGINIANKQKNLSDLSDKLLSIFQDIFAKEMQAPGSFSRMMQNPAMAKSFENILEYGGMSIANFSTLLQAPQMQPVEQPQQAGQAPAPAPQLTMNQNA